MNYWKNIDTLSKEELRVFQNKKLYTYINSTVYPFSPHYQRVFNQKNINPRDIRCVEDLQKIPFSSKLDFIKDKDGREVYEDFILQPDEQKIRQFWPMVKKLSLLGTKILYGKDCIEAQFTKEFRPVFMTYTTGTTNQPVPFLYSNYDIQNLHISGARLLNLFNVDSSQRILNMFPFAPHLAFWQVVFGGLASNALTLSTGGGKAIGTEGNISALLKMKPTTILGVPGYVYHVLHVAQSKGCSLESVKKVVLGASRVTKAFKLKLASMLEGMGAQDVSIFGTYGFTESRCAWGECPTPNDISSGYHLYPDKEIFEIIDPDTGEIKKEGEDGEIVYTSLDGRASSVVRYRTGDFVKGGITYEPCPHCHRRLPRLSSDITRLSNIKDLRLSKVKGSLVNFNNFSLAMALVDQVDEWQIELKKKNDDPFEIDELNVYVCLEKECNKEELERQIGKQLLFSTEVTPNKVVIISRDEMIDRLEIETANKEKRIVDNRPQD